MNHYKDIAAGVGHQLRSLTTTGRENTSSSATNSSAGEARVLSNVTPTIPSAEKKTRTLCEDIMARRVVNRQQLDGYRADGANPRLKVTYGDIRSSTPLHCAATAGNGMAVAAIVASEQQGLVDEANGNGLTPLALICGAKILDERYCPRFSSTAEEHDARLTGLEALLGANANQYHRMGRDRLRPIHYAARSNFPGLIRRLVEQEQPTGIDSAAARTTSVIDSQDRLGNTPLHVAAKHNALEATETLIDLGAQTTVINSQGQTPLHLLCMDQSNNNHRGGELACLLLSDKSHVDGDLVDKQKNTWLGYAAKNGMNTLLDHVKSINPSALSSHEQRIKAAHAARRNVDTGRKSNISPEAASKVFSLLKSFSGVEPHNLQGMCLVVIRETLLKKLEQDQQSIGQGACGATRSLDDAVADLYMYFRDKEKLCDDRAFFN